MDHYSISDTNCWVTRSSKVARGLSFGFESRLKGDRVLEEERVRPGRGAGDAGDQRENGQFNFCECLPEIISCPARLGLIAWFRQTSLVQPDLPALSSGIRSTGIRLSSNRLSSVVGIPNTLGISSFLIQLSVVMVLCHGTYETAMADVTAHSRQFPRKPGRNSIFQV